MLAPSTTRAPTAAQRVAFGVAIAVGVALRWWDLGSSRASFDEAFTGVYSHLTIGQIPAALRRDDAHPPLDYLLRHWFGTVGDTAALRVPSALWATVALVVMAAWMWRRGWFGVTAVAVTSVSAFQLLYAHQARMYMLMALCGTVAALAAERWWGEQEARWRWLMGGALLVALFDHSSALLLAGALVAFPGVRRDGEAWRWRLTVGGALVVWAAIWGPSFVHQFSAEHSSWIPYTGFHPVVDALNGLVTMYDALAVVVVLALVVGGVLLVRSDPVLGRVYLALFALPFAAACLIGLRAHFLLPRTLAFAAWAPALALAAVVDQARRRSAALGWAAGALVAVLVVGSIGPAITYHEDSVAARQALVDEVRPGDAVVVHPSWLWPLAGWDLGAPWPPGDRPPSLAGLDAYVFVVPGGTGRGASGFDGRVWVLQPDTYALDTGSLAPCGSAPVTHGGYVLSCYQAPVGAVPGG